MTKFLITTMEYYRQDIEVDASNLQEALDIIDEGGGVDIGEPVFIMRDPEVEFWRYRGEDIGDIPEPWEDIVE